MFIKKFSGWVLELKIWSPKSPRGKKEGAGDGVFIELSAINGNKYFGKYTHDVVLSVSNIIKSKDGEKKTALKFTWPQGLEFAEHVFSIIKVRTRTHTHRHSTNTML